MEMYKRLIVYKSQHQSTTVPRFYKEDPQLASWINHQRTYYKNNKLSFERINYLESVGFIWKLQLPWIEMFKRLIAYKQCHQSMLVPSRYTKDPCQMGWQTKRKI